MLSIYWVIDAVIAIGLLLLSLVTLLNSGYKSILNRIFAFFSFSVAVWIIANNLSNDMRIAFSIALFANYVVFAAALATAILMLLFVIQLGDVRRLRTLVNWLQVPLWLVCAISATPLVVAGVAVQGRSYAVEFGPLIWLYMLVLLFVIIAMAYALIHGLLYVRRGSVRRQLKAITLGLCVSLPLVLLLAFIIPSVTGQFYVTQFGLMPIIFLVVTLYYSVVRYKLFDIKLAAVRTTAYLLALLVLAGIYYALAYLVSSVILKGGNYSSFAMNPASIVIALLLAFIFQPIKRFFDRITNAIFYRDTYNANEFFARLANKLSTMTDLDTLLHYSAGEISQTLKASFGTFYIYHPNHHRPFFVSTDSKQPLLPLDDAVELARYVRKRQHDVVVTSLLNGEGSERLTRRLLISHHIAVVLPLLQDDTLLGYFFLGDNLSSQYSQRDIVALQTIADELTIAVENALSVQEVRDVNEHLQQRIDNATKELRRTNEQLVKLDEVKDEFMSMASHQLRTPLTTIKGYISMVIEGDAGKITPAQKHLLSEAFESSERMVRLIADFLNVSRLQTGKFMIEKIPTDLAKVVAQEIDELTPNATARGIKFIYKKPKAFPVLDLDDTKIRQVIMNFADNAMYYSGTGTTVIVTLKTTRSEVIFTVEDQGIGVPKDQQDELFQKFFRASNARTKRPDGTGVGLFLAKKVIDGHGGSIIFKSTEGKGSTFGFRLPLKKLKVDEV